MSCTVDILRGEVPLTYEGAIAVRDELARAQNARLKSAGGGPFEPPSPAMADLHHRLAARHPCICDDPDGPWSDGPLINNFGQSHSTLGLSFSRVEEVLPFLVQTATERGFWVLDPQDEAVHLPGGTVLRPLAEQRGPKGAKRWWRICDDGAMVNQTRLAQADRSWRAIVFSRTAGASCCTGSGCRSLQCSPA